MAKLHPRALIRKNVRAMMTNKTDCGDRVTPHRFRGHPPKNLPAMAVYTLATQTEENSKDTAPLRLEHAVTLAIEIVTSAAAPEGLDPALSDEWAADDALDAVCLQVEQVMASNPALEVDGVAAAGGPSGWHMLESTEIEGVETNDQTYVVAVMTFTVWYERRYPAEGDGADVENFKTADIVLRTSDATPTTPPAHSTVELPIDDDDDDEE